MVDVSTPASTRVRAADCILDFAKLALEFDDILRLTALEQNAELPKTRAAVTLPLLEPQYGDSEGL
jgi:hypothetical protein